MFIFRCRLYKGMLSHSLAAMNRNLKVYLPITVLIILIGLPARIFNQFLPFWYVQYFGDFLWAMLIYFLYCLIFKVSTLKAGIYALTTTYLIETSQLFHPPWLQALRSFKPCALILGFGFLWSDIICYTLGILAGSFIDRFLIKKGYASS